MGYACAHGRYPGEECFNCGRTLTGEQEKRAAAERDLSSLRAAVEEFVQDAVDMRAAVARGWKGDIEIKDRALAAGIQRLRALLSGGDDANPNSKET